MANRENDRPRSGYLEPTDRAILRLFEREGRVRIIMAREELDLGKREALTAFNRLARYGWIEQIGEGNTSMYRYEGSDEPYCPACGVPLTDHYELRTGTVPEEPDEPEAEEREAEEREGEAEGDTEEPDAEAEAEADD